ncbi:hypothetical protein Tco_1099419 [Tanacetum coccineum]
MNESELNNIHMNESEMVHSVFNNRESDVDDNPVNDRFKIGEGFHAVPPSYTGNYLPPRPDLSFVGLDESVFKSVVRNTTTSVPENETSISKTGSGYQQKDRKPSQNDKTEHGMEKTVQNQGQSPKMSKSESILKNQQSNRSQN